jgi:magnesium transporter
MIIDCAVYRDGRRLEGGGGVAEAKRAIEEDDEAFAWVGLFEPREEEFADVRAAFKLHELAVEDAIKAQQRPKLEVYGDSLFIVIRPTVYLREQHDVQVGEILLFVGPNFVVSVRHGQAGELAGVRRAIEGRPDLLRLGPSAVVYGVLDHVVDGYRRVSEDMEDQIQDEIEAEVLLPGGGEAGPEEIYTMKREVLEFHSAVAPLLEPVERLAHRRVGHVEDTISQYLVDVQDHLIKVIADVHRFREILNNAMDLYLSSTSTQQNRTLGRLTIIASLFLPLSFLSGFFGMNFGWLVNNIGSLASFAIVVGIMAVTVLVQLVVFRRQGLLG